MGSLGNALLTGFICRVCSNMNKVVIHVFGEEGKRLELAKKMKILQGVDMYKHDNLPKTVCRTCCEKLKKYYDWLQLVLRNQREFENTSGDELSKSNESPSETNDT